MAVSTDAGEVLDAGPTIPIRSQELTVLIVKVGGNLRTR
jgi:hypothetical protein